MLVPVIQVYEEVDSTNNILMQKNCIYPSGHACFAEKQYKGRGLSNKSWIAAESNVCFSVAWNYKETLKTCHSTVGAAILNTSITIVFGFSILVLSKFIPTIYFGVFTGLAMLLAMISVLTLLPALILIIKPFRE